MGKLIPSICARAELFDSQFEFAMRSWALQSPEVAHEIRQADAQRVQALAQMFDGFGFAHDAAVTRARSIYLTQIGYISMNTQKPMAQRMRYIPEYLKIFTGVEPLPRELDRFFQRNGFFSGRALELRRAAAWPAGVAQYPVQPVPIRLRAEQSRPGIPMTPPNPV